MPLKETKPTLTANSTPEVVEKQRAKSRQMLGLVLGNPDVVLAMDREGAGQYIKAKLKKDGSVAKNGSVEDFENIFNQAENQIRKMAGKVAEGDFWAFPLRLNANNDPCRFCDYEAVCLRDAGDPVFTQEENESEGGGLE